VAEKRATREVSIAESFSDDEDEIALLPTAGSSMRNITVAIPVMRNLVPNRLQGVKKSRSSAESSLSSIPHSRESSLDSATPRTTPGLSDQCISRKRKRTSTSAAIMEINGSDEEMDDEALARKLQEHEYAKDAAGSRQNLVGNLEDSETELSDVPSFIQPAARSDTSARGRGRRSVQAMRSDQELRELDEDLLPLASSSRTRKQTRIASSKKPGKTALGLAGASAKRTAVENSSGEDSDDSPPYVDDSESDASDARSTARAAQHSDDSDSAPDSDTVPSSKRRKSNARSSQSKANRRGAGRRFGRISARRGAEMAEEIEEAIAASFLTRRERERKKLEKAHPSIKTMWKTLESVPIIKPVPAEQPASINRQLKSFQLEGLNWMTRQEKTQYKGGLLGDEMGMGKTIQAVSLIMSDYPQKDPTLVLVPPVALMQWSAEINAYTDGKLKVLVYHGSNAKTKNMTIKDLRKYDVIMISYNSLESLHRKETKGWTRGEDIILQKSPIHGIYYHRLILDEAHSIKSRTTGVAKACFALKGKYKWCLSGTPVQNRIGEFFSLLRFLEIRPFADYFCKRCPCSMVHWELDEAHMCKSCKHTGMEHVSVFNQEILNPLTMSTDAETRSQAMDKLHMITARVMLRRVKRDHTSSMELPPKEVIVHNEFFGDIERDFSSSIMGQTTRKFDTYVARGVMLNNYANIFGLIMQMRQVANHPDLLLKKHAAEGQNVLVCNICDEVAEDAIRSQCKHDFCRSCAKSYVQSIEASDGEADCPRCHIALAIDFDQPEIEQDEENVKKSSIINRIKMENWTSSTKIEMLIYDLYKLRSKKQTLKSIVFSQFTSMLQLIEWRLRRAGFNTVMLDGSMTPAQRQRSIEYFMNNTDVEIFLVSLKAGGVALNLVEASRVFIVDPWWNPAAEWQSADRCHRIGQRRPCVITRLCIEDSVESRIVMLQEKKANMINGTINNDKTSMEKLTPEDMQFLFRGT